MITVITGLHNTLRARIFIPSVCCLLSECVPASISDIVCIPVYILVASGPVLDRFWTGSGAVLVQFWSGSGTDSGPILVPILVRSWSLF